MQSYHLWVIVKTVNRSCLEHQLQEWCTVNLVDLLPPAKGGDNFSKNQRYKNLFQKAKLLCLLDIMGLRLPVQAGARG